MINFFGHLLVDRRLLSVFFHRRDLRLLSFDFFDLRFAGDHPLLTGLDFLVDREQQGVALDESDELVLGQLVGEARAGGVETLNNCDDFFGGDARVGSVNELTLLEEVEQLCDFESDVLADRVGGHLALGEVLEDGAQLRFVLLEYALRHFEVFLYIRKPSQLALPHLPPLPATSPCFCRSSGTGAR